MANALTDPKGSLANFPPNTLAANKTTHPNAKEQSNASGGTYARGAGKDANDVQPGLRQGSPGFTNRPDAGSVTATAGIPGTFSGSPKPDDYNDANQSKVKASPTSAWTTGQYVAGNTSGSAGEMNWTGTAWATGRHA